MVFPGLPFPARPPGTADGARPSHLAVRIPRSRVLKLWRALPDMFTHLSKSSALLIQPFQPPRRSDLAERTDDFLALGSFTRRSCAARDHIEGTDSGAVLSHVIDSFAQFSRLKPERRPRGGPRCQTHQRHRRHFQGEYPVPARRPAHRWLVGPESR